MTDPEAPFFILFKGAQLNSTSVPYLMKEFLKNIGFPGLNMTCSTVCHATELQLANSNTTTDCAVLAGHSQRTQTRIYNDRYANACALAHVKLRQYAERERRENEELVNQFRQRLQIAELSATRRRGSAGRDEGPAEAESGEVLDEHAMDVEGGDTSANVQPQDVHELDHAQAEPTPAEVVYEPADLAQPDMAHADASEPSTAAGPQLQGQDIVAAVVPQVRQNGNGADEHTSFVDSAVEAPQSHNLTDDVERMSTLVNWIISEVEPVARPTPSKRRRVVNSEVVTLSRRDEAPIASISQDMGAVTPAPAADPTPDDRHPEPIDSSSEGTGAVTSAPPAQATGYDHDAKPIATSSQGTGAATPAPMAEMAGGEDHDAEPIASTPQGTEAVTPPAPAAVTTADDRYPEVQMSEMSVAKLLTEMNQRPCLNGPTRLQNEYEFSVFHQLCEAKPIQQLSWLEVREAPVIGKGVYAKVDMEKGAVVSDYRGKVLPFDEVDRMVRGQPEEVRTFVDSYLVEYAHHEKGRKYRYLVLAHEPVYKKAVIYGRLFNHSDRHPNLMLERPRYSTLTAREINSVLVLRTTRNIKTGEQLLWNYGGEYEERCLNQSCICNVCDPGLAAVALRAAVPAMIVAPTPFTCAEDAYRQGRRFVLGSQEEFVEALTIPEGANQLCRLLNASVKDAFEKANPVVLILRRRRRDRNSVVLLLGNALPDDSRRRYGNCLMFVEDVGETYIMAGGGLVQLSWPHTTSRACASRGDARDNERVLYGEQRFGVSG
ncbi:hypothetical protein Y032_0497g2504 [Ancylostoma ceylanicum]|nr:hypothetical protein Y032_0497g2504 [Ancylostoma ceylanicum]